jgi:hypothetical protein
MYGAQAKASQAEGAVFQVQSLGSAVEPGAGAAPGAGVMGEVFQAQSKVYGAQSAASAAGGLFRGLGLDKLKPKKPPQAEQLAAAAAVPAAGVPAGAPQAAPPPVGESPAPGAAPAPPAPPGYETWMWPAAEQERKSPWRKILVFLALIVLLAAAGGVIWYTLIRDDSKSETPAAAKTPAAKKKPKPVVAPVKTAGGVKAFVLDLEPLLKASAANRVKIVAAVRGVSNGCSLAPAQGAAQAQAVEKNRAGLLKRLNALKPPNAQTAAIVASFRQALTASIDANRHYAKWMQSLNGASPCPGSPTSNDDFNAAEVASTKATAAKQALAKEYNPLAAKYGRQTFSADKI